MPDHTKEVPSLKQCPRCGSRDVAEYRFGMPVFSGELMDQIKKKEIKLGGCCVSGNDPQYHCNACRLDFGFPQGGDGGEGAPPA